MKKFRLVIDEDFARRIENAQIDTFGVIHEAHEETLEELCDAIKQSLVIELKAVPSWISPEGDCYPCLSNWDKSAYLNPFGGGHQESAIWITQHYYGVEERDIDTMEVQGELLDRGWVRVDFAKLMHFCTPTSFQRETLKQMADLPDAYLTICTEDIGALLEGIEQ